VRRRPSTRQDNVRRYSITNDADDILSDTAGTSGYEEMGCVGRRCHTKAFLCAERPKDKPLWASYPAGYKNPGRCMLLLRQLYGLHDAPMGFYQCLRQHLVEDQSFVQSANDEYLALTYGAHENETGFYGTCDASHSTEAGAKPSLTRSSQL
jgi:hypothetical protein